MSKTTVADEYLDFSTGEDEKEYNPPLPADTVYGGYREVNFTDGTKRAWLRTDQLTEWDDAQDRFPNTPEGDDAWWKWFVAFRSHEKLYFYKPVRPRAVGFSGESSWGGSFDRSGWASELGSTGKSDKRWWQKDWSSTYKGLSKSTEKLAVAMTALRATARIIDDHEPPMQVQWADTTGNFTNFHTNIMVIDASPVVNAPTTEDGQTHAIDLVTAELLHEVSHRYSRHLTPAMDELGDKEKHPYGEIEAYFGGLVEDVRIEMLTSDVFPGFAWYFPELAREVWSQGGDKRAKVLPPPVPGDKEQLMAGLTAMTNVAWGAMRLPDEAAEWFTDPSWGSELEWWADWAKRYCASDVGKSATAQESRASRDIYTAFIAEAMEHVKDYLPELEPGGSAESPKGAPKPCVGGHKPSDQTGGDERTRIASTQSEEMEAVIEEKLRKHNPERLDIPSGVQLPEVRVRHPVESDASRRGYKTIKLSPLSSRMRDIIRLRPDAKTWSDRILRSGELDEEELWRVGADDYRVFEQKTTEMTPHAHVALLLDLSGSMNSWDGSPDERKSRVDRVCELGLMFAQALNGMEGITAEMWGHTGDYGGYGEGCDIYELWKNGEAYTRIGIPYAIPHGNNYDGFAIEYVAQQLLARGELSDQRLLIVFSDGEPYARGYSSPHADQHVRNVVKRAMRNGVDVVQIAVSSDLKPKEQSFMFPHWVGFQEVGQLIRDVGRLLDSTVNKLS
jgi:hypothetical protein